MDLPSVEKSCYEKIAGAADDRLPRAGDCAIKAAINLCFRKSGYF
jgi:hypothetical protein